MLRVAVIEGGDVVETIGSDAEVPWWSCTKTVLAAAALTLVRDGRLALDEALPGRPYTLRQLLQHRSGLAEYGALASYHRAVADGDDPWPVEELLERVDAGRLRYEPGQGWDYSNIGYLFVRQIIEEATGLRIGPALQALVFEPLGVTGLRVAETPADLRGVDLGTIASYHPGWVYHRLLVGTPVQVARLHGALMTGDFLPPDLMDAMRTPHPLGGGMPGRPWRTTGYGLGLMIGASRFGGRAIGHSGGGPGSVCAVYHFPERRTPVTVATFMPGDRAGRVEAAAFRRGA